MNERELEIQAASGAADAFFCHPDGQGPWPGVLLLTDIAGIRPAYRDRARRLAGLGYAVLAPNVFYRTGPPPVFDFKFVPGEERSMKRVGELTAPVTPKAMENDSSSYVDFLASCDVVGKGPMGVVGYCFTGAMAMRTAAVRADRIGAAASFHGVRLYSDTGASPHLELPRIKARLYFGHAIKDNSMPEEAIEKLDRALEAWGGRYESEIYEGAYHGWTTPDGPVYNHGQAERAFEKLTELFAATLK
ncbi:MAG TPA: dienelactone hydrolase family protein [Blastocatellia bacterium]|nr:dienelactone hydrolase family protein [Blastocatellia bacterium]